MTDKTASTDLEVRASVAPPPIRGVELEETWRVAKALAMSNYFQDAKGAEQAFAKILFGRDLGLGPTAAMTGIHIIEGRPELSANLQAQRVKSFVGVAGERYDYKVLDHTADRCEIAFYRQRTPASAWETLGTSVFTLDDARKAGLVRPRSNWEKWPRNMVFARAVSNGVAWHCPEVMSGLRVYADGEVHEQADAAAEMLGDPGTDGEDLSYLDTTAEDVGPEEALRSELARIDRAIAIVEATQPVDEDALAELSGERDALMEATK